MRIKLTQGTTLVHKELVGALGWNVSNELVTCSDDQVAYKWSMHGEPEAKVCQLDSAVTDLHWYPVSSRKQQSGGTDVFAVAGTDGSFRIYNKSGRLEKATEAHHGAVICLRWSYEGSALATGGEDGLVKVWSRNGMLRSTLAQAESPVYALAWAADSDQLLFASGQTITIKSLQSNTKNTTWRAHDGLVLKVDWSPINNLIVSASEDCRYKVWDCYGRLLFQSAVLEHPVTSVAWCPSGELFAVGSYDSLQICDRMGWSYCKARTDTGSLMSISWTADGTQLAAAGGSGSVCFGQLVDIAAEDNNIYAIVEDVNKVVVNDIVAETKDELDFRDRVIWMSLGFTHLILATAAQCHIYDTRNFNTPHIFDLKDIVHLILQCERCFLTVDHFTGIQLYSYEGRHICNPRFQGLHTEFLNQQMMSLSNDTLAVLDHAGSRSIRFFDTAQGKPVGEPYVHSLEVREIALSQHGTMNDRHLVVVDSNRDLYIVSVAKRTAAKLGSMVDSAVWHDSTPMLAAIVDEKLTIWYCPHVVYMDKELLANTKYIKADSDFGKAAQVKSFNGPKVVIRRSDGAQITAAASPHPLALYDLVKGQQWDKAVRLCRFIKDAGLWACLASMALEARELSAAEAALAATSDVDKLRMVVRLQALPSEESRAAELALLRHRPDEAEAILLQAGLIYRAVKLNVRLFDWDRALDLAQTHQQHQDTVLYYRNRHLTAAKVQETNKRFQQLSNEVQVDEQAIKTRIRDEKTREGQRRGAKQYM